MGGGQQGQVAETIGTRRALALVELSPVVARMLGQHVLNVVPGALQVEAAPGGALLQLEQEEARHPSVATVGGAQRLVRERRSELGVFGIDRAQSCDGAARTGHPPLGDGDRDPILADAGAPVRRDAVHAAALAGSRRAGRRCAPNDSRIEARGYQAAVSAANIDATMAAHAVRRQDPRADPAPAVEQAHQRAIDREMAAWRRQQPTIFCAEEGDEEGADEEISCLPGRSAICRRAGGDRGHRGRARRGCAGCNRAPRRLLRFRR